MADEEYRDLLIFLRGFVTGAHSFKRDDLVRAARKYVIETPSLGHQPYITVENYINDAVDAIINGGS